MSKMLSLLVLSCDKYSDLWLDFFKLRDKYWSDCDFDWYLVTESADFSYDGVNVIHTGTDKNWTGRLKFAVEQIDSPYIGWYLDDFYIYKTVDNTLIHELVDKMDIEHIDHINMSDVFDSLVKMPEEHVYHEPYLFEIPRHKKYGISTASAIWGKDYLLKTLGDDDKNAWQFEIDLCKQALSEEGLNGTILCDERKPFNVTPTPIVIQGKYYPKAIKEFAKMGLQINYKYRGLMSPKNVFIYDFNSWIRNILRSNPGVTKVIKWVAKNIFRVKFFT